MSKLSTLVFFTLAAGTTHAAMTLKDVPNSPPPYGAYYVNGSRVTTEEKNAREAAVAKRYGFTNLQEAYEDCVKANAAANFKYACVKDSLAHKRDADPVAIADIKKYGFRDWREAVEKCESKIERGDVAHCTFDPFLKLRVGR